MATRFTDPLPAGSPMLAVLKGTRPDGPPPVWLMRQAGRYLPEYRALRADKGGFLDLVYDPAAARKVTLQPIRRFGFDAAILFSDILVVPHAMGQGLRFELGEGPRLEPAMLDGLSNGLEGRLERLDAIYATVSRVRVDLPSSTALLGFSGSPWTVATYMVAGRGSRDQADARRLAYRDRAAFAALIEAVEAVTIRYLRGQADAGVDAVQLFDSWAGSLAPSEFERWVLAPTARIVAALHESHPGLPVIGFPKGAGARLPAYARETGVDAIGLDESVDPLWAHHALPAGLPVQGNLDPLALEAGGEALADAAARILRAFAGRPHIFNLGHGILQTTPVGHVDALLRLVRGRP